MEKPSFNPDSSLETKHTASSLEMHSQHNKPFHIREYYSPSSKVNGIEGKYQKVFHRMPTQASEVLITLNGVQEDYLENSMEFRTIKENFSGKGGLEAVPERSNEQSEMTNKTYQLDSDLQRLHHEYDIDEKNLMRPLQSLLRASHEQQYRIPSTILSENLNTRGDESGRSSSRENKYLYSKQKALNGEILSGKPLDSGRNERLEKEVPSGLDKESLGNILSNDSASPALKEHKKSNTTEKEPQSREPHYFGSGSSLRNNEYDTKLSKSNFMSHSFREDTLPRTYEQTEIMELVEQNEKLEEKVKKKEELIQDMMASYDDLYKRYREARAELDKSQIEKELYSAQKLILAQLEERERTSKRENDQFRQNEIKLSKVISELEAQVDDLKADLNFMNSKNEAKIGTLKLEIKRLEEENLYLLKEKRKKEAQQTHLTHLELSNDEEKLSLRRTLEEKQMQLHNLINKNEGLVHKLETLKKINHEKDKAYRDEIAYENKRTPEKRINDVKEEARQHYQSKISHYRAKIDKLTDENENLKFELQSKPSLRKFKENEARIHELEGELQALRHEKSHRRKHSDISATRILQEIAEELNSKNIEEILPKIRELQHEHRNDSKFVSSLLDLVQKCSPRGYFEGRPTYKQAWSWIKRLMEEYMTIKKHEGGNEGENEKEILKVVSEILRIRDRGEIPGKLRQMIGEQATMNEIISKVKVLHKLEWVNSMNELDQRLRLEVNSKFGDQYNKSLHYNRANI